jgi:hypothetical protein
MTQGITFNAELLLSGKSAAGFEVPDDVVARLDAGGNRR